MIPILDRLLAPAILAAMLAWTAPDASAQVQYLPQAAPETPAPGSVVWTTAAATTAPESEAGGAGQPFSVGLDQAFEIIPLRYADVSEVVGLLTVGQAVKPNDSFAPQEPAFGSSGVQGGYFGGGISTPTLGGSFAPAASTEPLGQSVSSAIGIDRRLNAIVVRGAPDEVAALKQAIAKLDIPVDSVVLETVFVELTETGARNLGLDFNNANNQIATVAYNFSSGNLAGLVGGAGASGVAVNLQAAVYAQIAKGNGRIVSKPRISAQSGQTAKIVTGDALPILTSIAVSGVNAVQQEVQYVNVGVTLQIAPRVTDDGFVTSHVFAVVSSVTGFSQGYPTISQREASTSATVHDGDSFVIGGLTQETTLTQRTRLPIVGGVPALGQLLSAQTGSRSKTELYILVTPRIVRAAPQTPAPAARS
ncbi:MAG TPA: secretin N-terminal domain-containing protein [Caulobacteraceae bacterium]|nr:secretin N-terminal domain-containing protein [Caulobacteraceae bacterium]